MAQFKIADNPEFPYKAGLLPTREMALAFVDYLAKLGIKASARVEFNEAFGIYAARAEDVSKIKLELLRFAGNPFNKAYNQAAWERQAQAPKRERYVHSALSSFFLQPFTVTTAVEVISVLFYVLSFFPGAFNTAYAYFGLYQESQLAGFELWRLVTPVFFHFGILHIAFNLVMFEAFARPLERTLGHLKLFSLFIVIAMLSNALQFAFLQQPAVFGGMSGVVYGIIGYIGILSYLCRDLPSALRLPKGLLTVSVIFIAFGFFLSGIANFCHLGGIAVGIVWGFIDSKRAKLFAGR